MYTRPPTPTVLSWLVLALLAALPAGPTAAFLAPSASSSSGPSSSLAAAAAAAAGQRHRQQGRSQGLVAMRDASMVRDVAVGDRVRIKPGVVLDGRDWGGLEGTVASTWEKCEVDPHCCCAELGTEGPIRVDFQKADQQSAEAAAKLGEKPSDYQYFNEAEIELLTRA